MTMKQMKQMIEMRSMKTIREIEIETKQMTKTKQMIETRRMMNIRLIVYRNAQIIQIIDKISKNEIEMIVWTLISFLIDECRNFLMMKIDEYRDFSIEMMNHCRNFLVKMNKNDDCRNFVIFLKLQKMKFLELLIEIEMKKIVWKNFLLLTTREIDVSLMIAEVIFLSEVIVLQVIDLEMMILEIRMNLEI
jgi:predicted neutral ceramidase superfamily lipid hydrolase